ncbi:MAG: hypothetical protein PHU14_02165 [Methylovulum sp.]|nr:hypothetical protein [Methylovulum sp.]
MAEGQLEQKALGWLADVGYSTVYALRYAKDQTADVDGGGCDQ